jgi:undecaprenyl-diphosphatase
MTIIQAIILGIVQGATEFLPISSSAHLVLVPWALGWKLDPQSAFVFDVLVQLGTLLAVIAFIWGDLTNLLRAAALGLWEREPFKRPGSRLAWLLVLASLPAAVAGIALKDPVGEAFSNPLAVSALLLLNAGIMAAAELLQRLRTRTVTAKGRSIESISKIGMVDALTMGLMQAFALFPGISRSGSTISGGLARNLERATAARFSFLMSVPIMLAAGSIALVDLIQIHGAIEQIPGLLAGFITAGLVGYFSIRWLLGYLADHSMFVFVIYCAAIGLLGILGNVYLH